MFQSSSRNLLCSIIDNNIRIEHAVLLLTVPLVPKQHTHHPHISQLLPPPSPDQTDGAVEQGRVCLEQGVLVLGPHLVQGHRLAAWWQDVQSCTVVHTVSCGQHIAWVYNYPCTCHTVHGHNPHHP